MIRTQWKGVDNPESLLISAGLPIPDKPTMTISDVKSSRCNCVYFVWLDEMISYIGKTVNIQTRMRKHHKGFTGEEKVSIIAFDSPGAEAIAENIYVAAYSPPMNCVIQQSKPALTRRVIK